MLRGVLGEKAGIDGGGFHLPGAQLGERAFLVAGQYLLDPYLGRAQATKASFDGKATRLPARSLTVLTGLSAGTAMAP